MLAWIRDHGSRSDVLIVLWLIIAVPVLSIFLKGPVASPSAVTVAFSFAYFIAASCAFAAFLVCLAIASARFANDATNAAAVYWSLLLGACEVLVIGLFTFMSDRPKEHLIVWLFILFCAAVIAVTGARFAGLAMRRVPSIERPVPRFFTAAAAPFLLVTAQMGASGIGYFLSLPIAEMRGLSVQTFIVLGIGIIVLIPYTAAIFFFGIIVPRLALMSREERRSMVWFKRYLVFTAGMAASTLVTSIIGRMIAR